MTGVMRGRWRLPQIAWTALLLFGCDLSDLVGGEAAPTAEEPEPETDKGQDDHTDYPDVEDGTCSSWKFAYCDAIAACSAFETRQECEFDLGWLVCTEDAPLAKCQTKIEAALKNDDCEALPQDCTPDEIADRTLPHELCQEIHVALCEYRLYCGLELSLEGCVETLDRVEPCDSFTSFLPTAVDCADAYDMLGCGQPMPQVCAGSLRK